MSDKIIYALTGLPGVGKSSVAERLANSGKLPIVNMGEEMKKQYQSMPISGHHDDVPQGTWEMAQALRDKFGPEGPAVASVSRVGAALVEHDRVVVDGIRSIDEVWLFSDMFIDADVHLIKVTADYDTRLDRFYDRGDYARYDVMSGSTQRVLAEKDMNDRTEREAEEGLRNAIEEAEYEIDNSGSLKDAEEQCLDLLDELDPIHG